MTRPTPDTEPPPPDDGTEPAGLARVRMMQTGHRAMPGMWRTLGMRLVDVAEGRAVVEVDYHRPVPLTHRAVVATAEVVQRGRRLAHADARITVGGRLVASGRAVFAVFDRR